MSRSATTSKQQLCCITLNGYDEYILPAADGMKVVQLLATAQRVNSGFTRESGTRYELVGPANVQWRNVRHEEVSQPVPARPEPASRTRRAPLALAAPGDA